MDYSENYLFAFYNYWKKNKGCFLIQLFKQNYYVHNGNNDILYKQYVWNFKKGEYFIEIILQISDLDVQLSRSQDAVPAIEAFEEIEGAALTFIAVVAEKSLSALPVPKLWVVDTKYIDTNYCIFHDQRVVFI